MGLYEDLKFGILNAKRNDFDKRSSPFLQESIKQTKGVDWLTDFNRDETGGPLSYYLNRAEPMRVRPKQELLFVACWAKKQIVNIIYEFRDKGIFGKIGMALSIWLYYNLFLENIYYGVAEYMPSKDKLAPPVKELYRILTPIGTKIRDIICMIMIDMAYRYRLQDILSEVNKENLKKHPAREILRLTDLLVQREHDKVSQGFKWEVIKLALRVILLKKKLREQVKEVLLDLNIDEIKLNKADIYWTNYYENYDFRGMTNEEREQDNRKRYGDAQVDADLAKAEEKI